MAKGEDQILEDKKLDIKVDRSKKASGEQCRRDTHLKDHKGPSENTIAGGAVKKARFRPHHIFCERFLEVKIQNRGEEFERVSQKRRETIERQDDVVMEVVEGIDELCRVCPDCRDERCQNPRGDEEAVRKWDGIILKGLEINYGETRTSKEWRVLINQKAPLNFCETRCPYRSSCTVFQLGLTDGCNIHHF